MPAPAGDINGDQLVDLSHPGIMLGKWGWTG